MTPFALVTDPNSDLADCIAAVLELRGYEVSRTISWHDALARSLPADIRLIVAHAAPPAGRQGPSWLESVLQRFPRSAVVVTSGRQDEPGLANGRCVYLAAPFDNDALIRAISVAEALVDDPVLSSPSAVTSFPDVMGFEVPFRDLQESRTCLPIVVLLGGTPTPEWVKVFEQSVALAGGPLTQAEAVVNGDRVFLFSGDADARLVTQDIRKVVRSVSEKLHGERIRETSIGQISGVRTSFDRR